jgi:tRNA(Ile)-lysidine synthase
MTGINLQEYFNRRMSELVKSSDVEPVAAAVSGGSDSMALALLAHSWGQAAGQQIIALTVDHGLRAEAKLEALQVGDWLSKRGIGHEILTWSGEIPKSAVQAGARDIRYQLMAEYCLSHDIPSLLLGHQLEDQIETLLMRLSKGSGLNGLSAIRPVSERHGISLLRPLLGMTRDQLRTFLTENQQVWIEDPSNEDPKYTRTHLGEIRQSLQQLPGSSLETLALSADRLARASDALQEIMLTRFNEHCEISPFGFICFKSSALTGCPAEIGVRLLGHILSLVTCTDNTIRLKAIEKLYTRITVQDFETPETLAGCQIMRVEKKWIVYREPGRDGLPEMSMSQGSSILWDNRFLVMDTEPETAEADMLSIRRIGSDGWQQLKGQSLAKDEANLPVGIRNNLPALWEGQKLVAAPLFSCVVGQSSIAKSRFKMVFKPLVSSSCESINDECPIGTSC